MNMFLTTSVSFRLTEQIGKLGLLSRLLIAEYYNGVNHSGVARHGMEWDAMEWIGMGCNGMEWSGV
eukprot:scaffold70827_cov17-Prasinocladus_malaysianus.AAC.1